MPMTSSRPYLIRALYEWIVVNRCSPYLLVNAKVPGVKIPSEFVVNDKIVFNVNPQAVKDLQLGDAQIEFNARFSGKSRTVNVPINAVLAIYAKENGRGMIFNDEEDGGKSPEPVGAGQAKAKLKLVK